MEGYAQTFGTWNKVTNIVTELQTHLKLTYN